MNLHTRESILSLDVMGVVHVADEGVGLLKQSVYICVYTIGLDQKPSRSRAVFRLNIKPTGCSRKVDSEHQITVVPRPRQVWWDILMPMGSLRSGVDPRRKLSEENEVHKKREKKKNY